MILWRKGEITSHQKAEIKIGKAHQENRKAVPERIDITNGMPLRPLRIEVPPRALL